MDIRLKGSLDPSHKSTAKMTWDEDEEQYYLLDKDTPAWLLEEWDWFSEVLQSDMYESGWCEGVHTYDPTPEDEEYGTNLYPGTLVWKLVATTKRDREYLAESCRKPNPNPAILRVR